MVRFCELTLVTLATLAASAVSTLGGCRSPEPEGATPSVPRSTTEAAATERGEKLEVLIGASSGSELRGTATLTEVEEGGVRVIVDVAGVPPGKHGVHIHEKGDCSAPDATSAGEHFNPEGHPHALPTTDPRHVGDLGNIEVRDDGTGHLDAVAPRASLRPGDARSFRGRSIIVHAKPDDGSQPSGAAGARIGCGEIRG